jgi:RNA polymerase sigma-70 factor (ECF subfamily)
MVRSVPAIPLQFGRPGRHECGVPKDPFVACETRVTAVPKEILAPARIRKYERNGEAGNHRSPRDEVSSDANHDGFEAGLKPLWMRAQAGDEAAYRAALEHIAARLRRFFGRRLQALPDEVEDLVQETLLALHLQRGTYDASLPVSAWVHAIARHKLVDLFRRRGRREALHEPLDDLDEADHPLSSDAQPARRDLGVLIETLPAAQQQAIVLTKIEGLSMAEASARTGVSVAALKVQVHRGLKRLAELVRDDA